MSAFSSSLANIVAGLALSASFSASGCAQVECQERAMDERPREIVVNDDSYADWRKYGAMRKRYFGLSAYEVESQLMELARTARREDAWLYHETARELIDIGCDPEEQTAKLAYTTEMGKDESSLIFYHIHPCLCTSRQAHLSCTIREPVPSDADVAVLVKMSVRYRGKRVEGRVVNRFGVLRMSMDSAKYRGLPDINSYGEDFAYGLFDFEEYQRRCARDGIQISFEERAPFVPPFSAVR